MKWQFNALEQELQAIGKTFKDFYGQHVTGKLGDQLIHFRGKAHLLSATIKRNLKANGITEKVIGLHWDFGRKLEQLGVYSLSDVEHFAGGMYEATLHYGGITKKGKTFFPNHWDAKMLASKISEACYNAREIIARSDGVLKITGLVEEGFEIIVKIDKRGNIVTAYPDIVKNLAKGAL